MEDVEVLDLDNDNKKEEKKKNKRIKNKKKLTKGEKIFLGINLFIIIGIILFYGYRTVHFYKRTHNANQDITLKEKLTALNNISFHEDGLYENNGYFYYKGLEVNNYVYYSGRLFRIIDISSGIRMIEDNTSTNLVWGIDTDYNDSLINNWLKDYFNTLKDPDVYLKENTWCNNSVDVEKYSCDNTITSHVGLLSTDLYLQAGGKNSYLNNNTYFWTINYDLDKKPLYINKEGSINNLSSSGDTYYSYGIRPVITLNEDVTIISGDGTKNNPFIIENLGNAMLRDNGVGSMVKYHNQLFKILSIDSNGTTLIYDGVLEIEKNYNDVIKYLNNDYLKELNKDDLVKIDYSVNEYNYSNKYNYKGDNKLSNYVSIPQIGDLFLNDYTNYWLNNISDKSLGLYYVVDDNKMLFGDLNGNKHLIRPIIKLNSEMVVTGGNGMFDNPLIVGDNNVEED